MLFRDGVGEGWDCDDLDIFGGCPARPDNTGSARAPRVLNPPTTAFGSERGMQGLRHFGPRPPGNASR